MNDGKVALVTGSSSGIGRTVAARLYEAGWKVVLNGKNSQTEGQAVSKELGGALYVDADVSSSADAAGLVDRTIAEYQRLDLLVNNAGFARRIDHADFEAADDEFWDRVMGVNLKGPWNMTKAARPYLAESRGQVINTASLAGMKAIGSSIPYGVAKAGVIHLTKMLANTLGPEVRVNAVAPGLIDTPWTADWDDIRRAVSENSPARRIGTPEDVADVMMGLLNMEYTTGAIIPVTGGSHLA